MDDVAQDLYYLGVNKGSQGAKGVLIETDISTTLIGATLPSDVLEWLRNCTLKIISV